MARLRSLVVAAVLATLFPASLASAQSSDLQQKLQALKVIGDIAKEICTTAPLDQTSQGYQLSANAKASLSGLIRVITSSGISGGAVYTHTASQGVLQRDLATSIKTSNDCKLSVFNVLVEKLLGAPEKATVTAPPEPHPRPHPHAAAPVQKTPKAGVSAIPTAFDKPQGAFVKHGSFWIEEPPYSPGQNFTFTELGHDGGYVYLVDRSRQKPGEANNPMIVRLPLQGGSAEWSYQNPLTWSAFTVVQPRG